MAWNSLGFIAVLVCVVVCGAIEMESNQRIVMEPSVSHDISTHWIRQYRADAEHTVPLYFMLKNQNVELLPKMIMEVSNPSSVKYGNWLSPSEVKSLFEPHSGSQSVRTWLNQNNISDSEISVSKHGDIFHIPAVKVKNVEALLQTELYEFRHEPSGFVRIRAGREYSVPESISQHLDFVGGLTGFPAPRAIIESAMEEYSLEQNILGVICGPLDCTVFFKVICENGKTTSNVNEPCADQSEELESIEISASLWNLTSPQWENSATVPVNDMKCYLNGTIVFCYAPFHTEGVQMSLYREYRVRARWHFSTSSSPYKLYRNPVSSAPFATLKYLRDLYKIPAGLSSRSPENSQAVAEFLKEYFNQGDLNTFLELNGEPPMTVSVHGVNNENRPGGEASLDIQYFALARGVRSEFWSVDGLSEFHQEPFLKWVQELQAADGGPLVHSVSYGDDESSLSVEYMKRICNEIGKVALLGRSIIVSSGDDGAGGGVYHFHPEKGCAKAEPSFPATCPWVTAVGGTQMSDKFRPICGQEMGGITYTCDGVGEIAASTDTGARITSGGGFSVTFTVPDYQKDILAKYLSGPVPPSGFFNRNGRPYPDVSALSHNFPVYIPVSSILHGVSENHRHLSPVDGTSAAAPVFASMVSMMNDILLTRNKPPLGFLNPWLYSVARSVPEAFNDIVVGDNKCTSVRNSSFEHFCCDNGFVAAIGWDPVTGLGTPNFEILANAVLNPESIFPELGVQGLTGPEGTQGSATTSKGERTVLWILVSIFLVVSSSILMMLVNSAKNTRSSTVESRSLIDSNL